MTMVYFFPTLMVLYVLSNGFVSKRSKTNHPNLTNHTPFKKLFVNYSKVIKNKINANPWFTMRILPYINDTTLPSSKWQLSYHMESFVLNVSETSYLNIDIAI